MIEAIAGKSSVIALEQSKVSPSDVPSVTKSVKDNEAVKRKFKPTAEKETYISKSSSMKAQVNGNLHAN